MAEDIPFDFRDVSDTDLRNMLETVTNKMEAVRNINSGHGNTPEFWKYVAQEVRIKSELASREFRSKNTF